MKRPLRWPASRAPIFPRTTNLPLNKCPLTSRYPFPVPPPSLHAVGPCLFPAGSSHSRSSRLPGRHACLHQLHVPSSVLFMRHPSAGLFDTLSPVVSPWIPLPRNIRSRSLPGLPRTWLLKFSRRRTADGNVSEPRSPQGVAFCR